MRLERRNQSRTVSLAPGQLELLCGELVISFFAFLLSIGSVCSFSSHCQTLGLDEVGWGSRDKFPCSVVLEPRHYCETVRDC